MDLLPFKNVVGSVKNLPNRWMRDCIFLHRTNLLDENGVGAKTYTPVMFSGHCVTGNYHAVGRTLASTGNWVEVVCDTRNLFIPKFSRGIVAEGRIINYINRVGLVDYGRGLSLPQCRLSRLYSTGNTKIPLSPDKVVGITREPFYDTYYMGFLLIKYFQQRLNPYSTVMWDPGQACVLNARLSIVPHTFDCGLLFMEDINVGLLHVDHGWNLELYQSFRLLEGVIKTCLQRVQVSQPG